MSSDSVIAPINVAPNGLLDFLQTKALGQNPNELLQAVRPTVDLTGFWMQAAQAQLAVTAQSPVVALGALTGTLAVTVPQNEVWIPLSIVLITTPVGAGDSGRAKPVILLPGVSQVVAEAGPSAAIAAGGTSTSIAGWSFLDSKPRILTGGMVITGFMENMSVVVTGVTVAMNFRYIKAVSAA